jgi:hypothetical protein
VYDREIDYSPEMLPKSTEILSRLVVMPVSLQMDEDLIRKIVMELQVTAEEILS